MDKYYHELNYFLLDSERNDRKEIANNHYLFIYLYISTPNAIIELYGVTILK